MTTKPCEFRNGACIHCGDVRVNTDCLGWVAMPPNPEKMAWAAWKASREAALNEAAITCDGLAYTGRDGEYLEYGPETNANEEIRKCANAIRSLK